MELLRNALDIVQSIDTDDQLDALELFGQRLDTLFDLLCLKGVDEFLRIDTDREGSDSNEAILVVRPIRCCIYAAAVPLSACRG
jgi:hypothetical protein